MTHQNITPYGAKNPQSFEGFSDEQFKAALAIGAAHYKYWRHMVLAEQAAAHAKAALSIANELQFCTPQHPANGDFSEERDEEAA